MKAVTTRPAPNATCCRRPKSASLGQIVIVKLAMLLASPAQARRQLNEEAVAALAVSIRRDGLLNPPVVRPVEGRPDHYEIVCGHTRVVAVKKLGWDTISVQLIETDDMGARLKAHAENAARSDLNPVERADELLGLYQAMGEPSQATLVKSVSYGKARVSQLLALARAPEAIKALVFAKKLTEAQARALIQAAAGDEAALVSAAGLLDEGNLSPGEAVGLIRAARGPEEGAVQSLNVAQERPKRQRKVRPLSMQLSALKPTLAKAAIDDIEALRAHVAQCQATLAKLEHQFDEVEDDYDDDEDEC